MKDIFLHFGTRIRKYWVLLLILSVVLFSAYCISVQAFRYSGLTPYDYLMNESISGIYVLFIALAILLMMVRMQQIYRLGRVRWELMRKKRSIYVCGDIVFLSFVIISACIIYFACIRYGYWYKVDQLSENLALPDVVPSFQAVLKTNPNFAILFPLHPLRMIGNLVLIVCMSSFLTYLVHFFAIVKKKQKDILIFLAIVIINYASGYIPMPNTLVYLVEILIGIACYIISVQTWSVKHMGGLYVKH